MDDNIISRSLNKGVPVWAPVNIRHIDLIANSSNPELTKQVIEKNFANYAKFLCSLGPSADIELFYTMMVVIDEETLERQLIFSPAGFISSLTYTLNYNNMCNNILESQKQHLTVDIDKMIEPYLEELKRRIEVLKNIKTHKQLKREFPILYRKYEELKERNITIKELVRKLNQLSAAERIKYIKNFEQQQRVYNKNFNFEQYVEENSHITIETFVAKYATVINNLIEHSDQIFDYLMNAYIDLSELNNDDQEKIDLFFASQYLLEAERVNSESKQDYLYYVSNYFATHPKALESNLYVILDKIPVGIANYSQMQNKNGYIMTARDLYERYRQILIDNPNLRAIDFSHLDFNGLSASEVKQFMDEYLKDLSANWDLLAPEDRSYEEEIISHIKSSGKELTEADRIKHQNRLLELFMEKKRLYDSSDPFFRVKGKDTFDGYIGYIYKNGRVVLDKFYEDSDSGKLADGHAVYAMGIQEFYEISKLSKSEIIRRNLCNRYIHTGSWAQRVLDNEINAIPTDNPAALVRKFIKTGDIQ